MAEPVAPRPETLFHSDPKVCAGTLHARGTRVLLANIVDSLAEGADDDSILRSYPSLRPEHLAAARQLAREWSGAPSVARVVRTPLGKGSTFGSRPFWLDENLPAELEGDLHARGVEVSMTRNLGLRGAPNTILMRALYEARAALLSLDEGIADRRRFPSQYYCGLILLCPSSSGRKAVRELVMARWNTLTEQLADGVSIVLT